MFLCVSTFLGWFYCHTVLSDTDHAGMFFAGMHVDAVKDFTHALGQLSPAGQTIGLGGLAHLKL